MRAFANANCVDRLHSTDRLLVHELYALCVWPGEPAPPARACTPPLSYDFVGMRIGLKRSGAERAVQRLRERGWVETEPDAETGFLVYHLDIARILSDLGTWGAWSTRDAKHCRPPSRKSRDETPRSPRWEGRGPRRPAHRRRPQSMPIEALTARWRSLWPAAPDPTATLARLLGQGASPSDLHRALDSLEGSQLTRPAPEFIADRYERVAYLGRREGPTAETPDPAGQPAAEAPDPPASVAKALDLPAAEAPDPPAAEAPDPPAAEAPDPPAAEAPDPPAAEAPEAPDPPAAEAPDPPLGEAPEGPRGDPDPSTAPSTPSPPRPLPAPRLDPPRPTAAGRRALAAFLAGTTDRSVEKGGTDPPVEKGEKGTVDWTTPESGNMTTPAGTNSQGSGGQEDG